MTFYPTLSFVADSILSALLLATLIYCVALERKLAMLRKGQDGLTRTIGELSGAIAAAGASMSALKEAANGAAETLNERVSRARAAADELSLLVASGERIAERIAGTGEAKPQRNGHAMPVAPAMLAGRLDAVKQNLRGVR